MTLISQQYPEMSPPKKSEQAMLNYIQFCYLLIEDFFCFTWNFGKRKKKNWIDKTN